MINLRSCIHDVIPFLGMPQNASLLLVLLVLLLLLLVWLGKRSKFCYDECRLSSSEHPGGGSFDDTIDKVGAI